jgi:predicted nucleotidyltransferase
VVTSAPVLSPLFRSDTQAELLARLILNPDKSYTMAALARAVHAPYSTIHREVQRLVRAGLLAEEPVGRAILLRVDTSSPLYGPVAELLRLSYGAAAIIPRVLVGISGIEQAYIYGSWAARRSGEAGDAPADIDVLVVGAPSRARIADAADEAERALGREVNIRIISPAAWADGADLFIKTVKQRPLIQLDLEGQEA